MSEVPLHLSVLRRASQEARAVTNQGLDRVLWGEINCGRAMFEPLWDCP